MVIFVRFEGKIIVFIICLITLSGVSFMTGAACEDFLNLSACILSLNPVFCYSPLIPFLMSSLLITCRDILSLRSLSCYWFTPSSTTRSPPDEISSLNFQFLLFSIKPSSSCLRLLPPLPAPYIFPSITCSISSP
jgi:hypothetical protein